MRGPSLAKCRLVVSERFGPSATYHRDDFDPTRYWLGYRDGNGDVVWVAGSGLNDCLRRHDCGARGTGTIPAMA